MKSIFCLIAVAAVAVNLSGFSDPPPAPDRLEAGGHATDVTFAQLLTEAGEAVSRGDFQTALAGYTALSEARENDISAPLKAAALKGRLDVDARLRSLDEARPAPVRLVHTYVWPVPAKVFWVLVVVGVAMMWHAVVHAFPRRGTTVVSFEDMTGPRPDRADRNRVLTSEVLSLLYDPTPLQVSELHMDIMPGTDEPGFGGLQPGLDVLPIEGYEYADRPLKIASFEFTIRDLLVIVARYFKRPPEARLNGWLSESENEVVISAQRTCSRNRSDPPWRVHRTGTARRSSAIADLAAMILVDMNKSKLTHSWQSFRSFHDAMKLRHDGVSPTSAVALAAARDHLERAVVYDPSNWFARFNLALTLCRADQGRTALKHFEVLESVLASAWHQACAYPPGSAVLRPESSRACEARPPAFQDFVDHMQHFPECAFLILYNKALALASLRERESMSSALRLLGQIVGLPDAAGHARFDSPYREIAAKLRQDKPDAAIELRLYALGAKASLLGASNGCRERRRQRLWEPFYRHPCQKEIKRLVDEIDGIGQMQQERHWRSLQTTRAVAHAAHARVLAAQGSVAGIRQACDSLEIALASEPHFVEAHLFLAELLIDHKGKCSNDWASRATLLLEQALRLNPDCGRATSLLKELREGSTAAPGGEAHLKSAPRTPARMAHASG
jgi:hypothetical protein